MCAKFTKETIFIKIYIYISKSDKCLLSCCKYKYYFTSYSFPKDLKIFLLKEKNMTRLSN